MLTISHTNIRHDVLHTELANAKLDPDGQVFPWRELYPLVGQTVYCDGQFWTVAHKEHGTRLAERDCATADLAMVQLHRVGAPNGLDGRLTFTATRGELRPVTWTQDDEDVFGDHVAEAAISCLGPAEEPCRQATTCHKHAAYVGHVQAIADRPLCSHATCPGFGHPIADQCVSHRRDSTRRDG